MNNIQQLRVQLEKMFEAMGGKEVSCACPCTVAQNHDLCPKKQNSEKRKKKTAKNSVKVSIHETERTLEGRRKGGAPGFDTSDAGLH